MLGKRKRNNEDDFEKSAEEPFAKKISRFVGSFFSSTQNPALENITFNFSGLSVMQSMIIGYLTLHDLASLRATNIHNKRLVDALSTAQYYAPLINYPLFNIYLGASCLSELKPIKFHEYLAFVQKFANETETFLEDLNSNTTEDLNIIGKSLFYLFGGDSYRLVNSGMELDSLPKLIQKCKQFDSATSSKVGQMVFSSFEP